MLPKGWPLGHILLFRFQLVFEAVLGGSLICFHVKLVELRLITSNYAFHEWWVIFHFKIQVFNNRFSILFLHEPGRAGKPLNSYVLHWGFPYAISSSLAVSLRLVWHFLNTSSLISVTFSSVFDVDGRSEDGISSVTVQPPSKSLYH